MVLPYPFRSFPARLVVGIVVLTVVTTLSAGAPAYWLTRNGLERQAWLHVNDAQQATQSLLQSKQERLTSVATLLSERPTLQRLLNENAVAESEPYLQTFQRQSGIDLLLLCDSTGQPMAGNAPFSSCLPPAPPEFQIVDNQPVALVSRWIVDEATGDQLGAIVVGNWIDEAFLRQMASDTGVAQSILSGERERMVSTLSLTASAIFRPTGEQRGVLHSEEVYYYVIATPITRADAPATLWTEVALPVHDLYAIQNQARLILIASTSVVALLGILGGIWYVRRLTTPLQQLTHAAEKISRGDMTTRVPTQSGPIEVITLTSALQKSQDTMLQTLNELAQARDWLDTLVQSIVEGVVTYDAAGRVTFLNQTAAALTHLSAEDALGRHVNELFHVAEEGGAHFLDHMPPRGGKARISIVKATGESPSPRFVSPPGQRSPRRIGATTTPTMKTILEITGAHLPGLKGAPMQTALVLRDITEEETLRHLRSYFLANITHEFRTPLSTLNASLELLMDEAETLSPAEIRELLKPVHLSLLGLRTLIDNLLESSSIEAGRFVLRKRPLDLEQMIAAAVQMVQPLLERRQQALILTESVELPQLQGDATRLTQVLVNLLTNASKYSPIGQPVDLTVEQIADRVRLSIADRGPGTPLAERTNLFRNFVRMDRQDTEQYGIGLGLYVVKTTVEAHGGRVGIDDSPTGGSIFWFELPLFKGDDAQ
jgi:signal transduction histidine kinase